MCSECFGKTEKGKEIFKKRELLTYVHPWCGMEFKIQRQYWEFKAKPITCCVKFKCDINPNECEIAKKNWK